MSEAWVVDIRNQCLAAKVPFFFKQWVERTRKRLAECSKALYGMSYRTKIFSVLEFAFETVYRPYRVNQSEMSV